MKNNSNKCDQEKIRKQGPPPKTAVEQTKNLEGVQDYSCKVEVPACLDPRLDGRCAKLLPDLSQGTSM